MKNMNNQDIVLLNEILTNQKVIMNTLAELNMTKEERVLNNHDPKNVEEVENIANMFKHIRFSCAKHEIKSDLLNFYGFNNTTPHFEIYRNMQLTAEEQKDMPWRYLNKSINCLEMFREMLSVYTQCTHEDDSIQLPLIPEYIEELIGVSEQFQNFGKNE